MPFARELFDHLVRYRRLRGFHALGARRDAAVRTYRAHALASLCGQKPATGAGWDDVAGFRMKHLGAEWMRYVYREVFAQREYWFATENRRPLILDCGGNIGMSTLFFKAIYPEARVEVFEPAPWACDAMRETFAANELRDIVVHNVALAEREGELALHHDADEPGSAVMSVIPGESLDAVHVVPAVRLSTYVNAPVDYLKLDVEGSEMAVLRDMSESGKLALVQQVGMEYHHHQDPREDRLGECLSLLERSGFGYQLTGQVYTPITRGQFQGLMIHAYRKTEGA